MQDQVVDAIVAHVERVAAHGVPAAARAAAKAFIADTLAVGVAGVSTPWREEILDMVAGGAAEARVWGSSERLPLVQAAMLNAYQIHGQEFDCVHEAAVVHPMAAVLPALLGWAEREGGDFRRSPDSRRRRRGRCRGNLGALLARADAVFSTGKCRRVWRHRRSGHAGGARCRAAARRASAFTTDSAPARCRRTPKERLSWRCRWALRRAAQ